MDECESSRKQIQFIGSLILLVSETTLISDIILRMSYRIDCRCKHMTVHRTNSFISIRLESKVFIFIKIERVIRVANETSIFNPEVRTAVDHTIRQNDTFIR